MRVVLINILVPQLGPPKQKFLTPPLNRGIKNTPIGKKLRTKNLIKKRIFLVN